MAKRELTWGQLLRRLQGARLESFPVTFAALAKTSGVVTRRGDFAVMAEPVRQDPVGGSPPTKSRPWRRT